MTSRLDPIPTPPGVTPSDAGDGNDSQPAIAAPDNLALVARYEIPRGLHLNAVVDALRQRKVVADPVFDAIYPERIRALSSQYWTPVEVAQRAAAMLVHDDSTNVLDVGSGAGKFCLVGALTTSGRFTGIEQRGHLVEVARTIAKHHGVRRARYVHGDIRDIEWQRFNAFYFFNSFAENCMDASEWIDDGVELTPERAERDLQFVTMALESASVGTRMVTYHGLGRDLPQGYERYGHEPAGSDVLELWVKVRS